jgi:hypothetical protein
MTQFRTHGRELGEFAIARETKDLKETFDERNAILEHDAGLPSAEAELEAVTHGPLARRGPMTAVF